MFSKYKRSDVTGLNYNIKKMTKILSPVCGDDSLAMFLMKGYNYSSPMARCLNVPIYDSDDSDITDDDLESEICQTCVFCARENIRHHKTKENEIPIIRRIRSPCRCFHECVAKDAENGKNFIMERFLRQKLDGFSPENHLLNQAGSSKRAASCELTSNDQATKIPRIISKDEIEKTRNLLKKEEIEIVEVGEASKAPSEVGPSPIPTSTHHPVQPVVVQCRSVAKTKPSNCHRMPQRVSVIQPTKIEDSSSRSSHSFVQRIRQSPAGSGRNSAQSSTYMPRVRPFPEHGTYSTESPTDISNAADTVIKVENTNHMEGYGNATMVLKQQPQYHINHTVNHRASHAGHGDFRILNSLGSQMSSISGQLTHSGSDNTFYIKQPYPRQTQSCHVGQSQSTQQFAHQFINARMQPHEENGESSMSHNPN